MARRCRPSFEFLKSITRLCSSLLCVCVCVCVCVSMRRRGYMNPCVFTCMISSLHTCACACACVRASVRVCVFVCMHARDYVMCVIHANVYSHAHTQSHTHTHTHVRARAHTHTHACTCRRTAHTLKRRGSRALTTCWSWRSRILPRWPRPSP